ncbi:MAG: HD domain-containing phosphohydrolase [bacterium]
MERKDSINLGNIVLSLSDALDLASPKLVQHQQRTTYIAFEMAKAANYSQDKLEGIFISSLLHDVGALSVEEKIKLHEFENVNVDTHCIQGEALFNTVSWLEPLSKIIRFHHKKWEDWGESINNPLVLDAQVLSLADYVERLIKRDIYILHQHKEIISNVSAQKDKMFNSRVIDLFNKVSSNEEFWLDLFSHRLYSILIHEGPYKKIDVDLKHIFPISELFRNIIDFRSHFTATHSSGVAATASELSKMFGFTETEVGFMEIAGNLHDLGKLSVPNSILEKPGKLTGEEFAIMKSHTYYTYDILKTIGGLQQVIEWAAYHHERFDGSGYPFHCKGDELSTGARIMMVADIFTAIAEDRPYRKGMSKKGIINILQSFSDRNLLDAKIVNVLFEDFDNIFTKVKEKQSITKKHYENIALSEK